MEKSRKFLSNILPSELLLKFSIQKLNHWQQPHTKKTSKKYNENLPIKTHSHKTNQ